MKIRDLLQDPRKPYYRNAVKAAAEMLLDDMDREDRDWPKARTALVGVLMVQMSASTVAWQKAATDAYKAVLECMCDESLPFCSEGKQ